MNGPLGRSGFMAAFSLIFLSEIGDKTFFIAALLAMKVGLLSLSGVASAELMTCQRIVQVGKWISFSGSLASLSIMTCISVAIGVVFSRVPDALRSSVPVGEIAGCALLIFFGVRALRVRLGTSCSHKCDPKNVFRGHCPRAPNSWRASPAK